MNVETSPAPVVEAPSPPPLPAAPVAAAERITELDVVRGFALLGILLMNIEYFTRPIQGIMLGLDRSLTGVDYVAVGPVYATTSKVGALAPRGLDLVRAARPLVPCPLVAIGGIDATTAPDVIAAGADAVAMIGALVRAPDPAAAVRGVLARLPT